MNSERIKMLEQFVANDPTDPFNRYALALELSKSDLPKAKEIFDELIKQNPEYVPSYYHAALVYINLTLNDEAIAIIEAGIAEARKQNNQKTANELNGLLDDL